MRQARKGAYGAALNPWVLYVGPGRDRAQFNRVSGPGSGRFLSLGGVNWTQSSAVLRHLYALQPLHVPSCTVSVKPWYLSFIQVLNLLQSMSGACKGGAWRGTDAACRAGSRGLTSVELHLLASIISSHLWALLLALQATSAGCICRGLFVALSASSIWIQPFRSLSEDLCEGVLPGRWSGPWPVRLSHLRRAFLVSKQGHVVICEVGSVECSSPPSPAAAATASACPALSLPLAFFRAGWRPCCMGWIRPPRHR